MDLSNALLKKFITIYNSLHLKLEASSVNNAKDGEEILNLEKKQVSKRKTKKS